MVPFERFAPPVRLLEIGTGSGWIAHYFASRGLDVAAVDITDSRQVTDGYTYRLITGTTLPFDESSFDVVLSNHVLEHVGDDAAQHRHLAEIRRVLDRRGVGYLAVPSRWMVVEPHFRLAFLSWLPAPLRSPYVRLRRQGEWYDCNPPSLRRIRALLRDSALEAEDITVRATRAFFALERPDALSARAANRAPDVLLRALRPLIPTHVYLLRR